MHREAYELEFERFLESADLDAAEDALFSALRADFAAGWRAAGGLRAGRRQKLGAPSPFRKSSRERTKMATRPAGCFTVRFSRGAALRLCSNYVLLPF